MILEAAPAILLLMHEGTQLVACENDTTSFLEVETQQTAQGADSANHHAQRVFALPFRSNLTLPTPQVGE